MFKNASLAKFYKQYTKAVASVTDKITTLKCDGTFKNLPMQCKEYKRSLQEKTINIVNSESFSGFQRNILATEYNLSLKYAKFCDNLQKQKKMERHSNNAIFEKFPELIKLKDKTISLTKFKSVFALSSVAAVIPIPNNETANNKSIVDDVIPDPPAIPDSVAESLNHVNALGEPTFASLGLGGWSPVGVVQNSFEYLHVTLGIPWWEAILIGTVFIRFAMFPLVVIAQRNAARMNNYLPQMQTLQLKMTEARQSGNQLESARLSQELMQFMKEKNLNPLKNMIVPLAQMPVFISFFIGLRQMANLPVESLRTGGLFWFEDLTVPDQYFAMPIITSLTLWATIELGTDGAKATAQMVIMRYFLRALPLIILPFTINFPGAILCYWVGSNFISLMQVGFLKIPTVRNFFNIEPTVLHKPDHLPIKPKGFTEGIKDSWTNIKITREIEERQRLNEMQFQRAGRGPVVKTYKYDPTKQSNPKAISVKERQL